jgi:hypothetical protein
MLLLNLPNDILDTSELIDSDLSAAMHATQASSNHSPRTSKHRLTYLNRDCRIGDQVTDPQKLDARYTGPCNILTLHVHGTLTNVEPANVCRLDPNSNVAVSRIALNFNTTCHDTGLVGVWPLSLTIGLSNYRKVCRYISILYCTVLL